MKRHVCYCRTFTGSLKIYQVIAAITSMVLLTVVDYGLNSNYLTVWRHTLLMNMVCSSFFLSTLVIFMSFVMGSTDVPCSIFYRVHSVLAGHRRLHRVPPGVHPPGEPPRSRQDRPLRRCALRAEQPDVLRRHRDRVRNAPRQPARRGEQVTSDQSAAWCFGQRPLKNGRHV
ncbi:hypothetical protein HPB50_029005 [Hyalomma asiaticum]|nr:hypothetical protein HPB50_029005 [Hyalomma asiaticum]